MVSLPFTANTAEHAFVHVSFKPTHLTSFFIYITSSDLWQLQLKPMTPKTSSYSQYILCFPLSHPGFCWREWEIQDVYFLKFVNYLRHVNIKAFLCGRNFAQINIHLQTTCYRISPTHNHQKVKLTKSIMHCSLEFCKLTRFIILVLRATLCSTTGAQS